MKQITIEKFFRVVSLDEYILKAMERSLCFGIAFSLTDMSVAFQNFNFNNEAKFEFLRNAFKKYMNMA